MKYMENTTSGLYEESSKDNMSKQIDVMDQGIDVNNTNLYLESECLKAAMQGMWTFDQLPSAEKMAAFQRARNHLLLRTCATNAKRSGDMRNLTIEEFNAARKVGES